MPVELESNEGFKIATNIELTPLHVAAAEGNVEKIKQLLDSGWDVNQENQKSATPIALASTYGHVEAVKLLIKRGAILSDKSYEGQTALHWAILNAHPEVVAVLLEGGADPLTINFKNGANAFKQAFHQLDKLTDTLLAYPEHTSHVKEAYALTEIIECLSKYMPQPLLVDLEKIGSVRQNVPASIFLEVFSSYVADNKLREYMLQTAEKISQIDLTDKEYILAKTFLNTFGKGNVAINLDNGSYPIMAHSDGFYPKYITQMMTHSLQEYIYALKSEQCDSKTLAIFEHVTKSYALATQYAETFASKETAQLALEHYHLNDTVILPTGWRGHCVAAIFSKSQKIVAFANAGKHYVGEPSGVIFYKLADNENISEETIHKILTNQDQSGLEFIHHYALGIESYLGHIETPTQTHGNCTYYSFKIAFEAALFIEYLNAGFSLDDASQKAHLYSKKFEYFHNTCLIDEVISKENLLSESAYLEVLQNITEDTQNSSVIKATADYLKQKLQDMPNSGLELHSDTSSLPIKISEVLSGWIPFGKFAAEAEHFTQDLSDTCDLISQPYHAPMDTALPHFTQPVDLTTEEAATQIW